MLTLATCAVAQAQSPAPRKVEEPATGAITGRVVNENGQAVAGAALTIRAVNSSNPGRNTTTDLEGNFRVNGLDPALYAVFASAPAYVTEPAEPIYYRVGDSVRVQLIKGGVVTGVVTNASGEPLVGVNVRVVRIRDANGQLPRVPAFALGNQSTDDRGVYRAYGLVPGTYVVAAGGGAVGFVGLFNPFESDIPTYSPSSTRDTAAEIVVRAGEETTADIRYRGEQGYSISGRVNISGNNGASITLTSVSGTFTWATFQAAGSKGFEFRGLSDGEYKLIASENTSSLSSTLPQTWLSEPKRITIKHANVTGIELTPKPMASISGRVSLEPSKVAECQGKRPPVFVETLVQARRNEKDAEEDEPGFMRGMNTATPDSSGAFVLRNLRPGRYRFEPRFHARYWYLQSITISAGAVKPQKTDAAATWTMVKSGEQLTNMAITLSEGAASLRGRVAVGEGSSPAALVYLVPGEPDKADDVLRYFVTSIDPDGVFTLNNLPPGKYLALTQTNVDAQTETLTKLRQPESAAARTKLRRSAETQKAEIELKPCQNVIDYKLNLAADFR